jgi:hypothetical protein
MTLEKDADGNYVVSGQDDINSNWLKVARAGYGGDEELPAYEEMRLAAGEGIDPKPED